jgi:large subunit ribosomal protein L24
MASRGILRAMKALNAPRKKFKPDKPIPSNRWLIVRGDLIEMLSGPEKGKQGVVQEVIRKQNRVVVDGLNVRQRALKPKTQLGLKGRLVTRPAPVHVTNVALVCPETGEATKARRRYMEDGTRVRVALTSGAIIPRPAILMERRRPRNLLMGISDTAEEDAHEITFRGWDEHGVEIGPPAP